MLGIPGTQTFTSIAKGFIERVREVRVGAPMRLFQHGVATIDLETCFMSHLELCKTRMRALGYTPTVILICAGTNSSGTGESAVVPGYLDTYYKAMNAVWPQAKIFHLGPSVDPANPAPGGLPAQARPEAGLVSGYISSACNGYNRHYRNGRLLALDPDEIHPTPAALTAEGRAMADIYLAGP